ncbi:M43 family zinc metalloprotease [Flavobacterium aestivum]|uniref:M43 family zinc metalloprotease n=1 Tax=Flavobacterium aestivum TaxID=3003257 RepID=UPI00248282F4|nr:M43 family zinc metalloprotease [Flavobacterium aestivum]
MKKKLFLLMFYLFVININAQEQSCRAKEENELIYKNNPNSRKERSDFDVYSRKFAVQRAKSTTSKAAAVTYTIPVVFHVYGTVQSGKTVTYEKIVNHLKQLNDDFNGLNADYNTVEPFFQARRSTLNIQFKLAKIDPNGGCTTGVVFHSAKNGYGNGGGYDDQIAADAWDNTKYMNIYIQNDLYNNGTLNNSGVAWYPDSGMTASNTARVVFNGAYLYDNSANKEFSSTLTHEFGHFLNLIHTFEGGCTGTDEVDDTPVEDAKHTLSCTPGTNCSGDKVNIENYMGYNGAQGCYKMFTQGQVTRMLAALEHPARKSLWQPANLIATGVNSGGASIASVVSAFKEAVANNGTFDGTSVIAISGTKTFSKSSGTLVAGTDYTSTFPAGITPVLTVNSNSQLTLSFTGAATNHAVINNSIGSITFKDAAFTGGLSGLSCTSLNFSMNFVDPYGIFYVDMADVNISAAQTWKAFEIVKGDDARYGGWRFAANHLKIETYDKKLVCQAGSRNITKLGYNVPISGSSNFVAPNAYPDELDLRTSTYTTWDGQVGYVGFQYLIDGLPCYGWFKVSVNANGDGYSITEYAYNTQPNAAIYTGITAKAAVTVSADTLYEADTNNGSVTSNSIITLSTNNATFTKSSGNLVLGTDYTISGVPSGLNAVLTMQNNANVALSFTGAASQHLETNSASVVVTFLNAAITGGTSILASDKVTVKIAFENPYGIYYVDMADASADTNNQWKYFETMPSDDSPFGAWWYAANHLKLETYTKKLVCQTGTRNITKLGLGEAVNGTRNITAPGAYPDQLDLRTPTYKAWDGQTGYIGFEYLNRGRICYGWLKATVAADGNSYTVLEYGYNTQPGGTIYTGNSFPVTVNAPSNLVATANSGSLQVGLTWTDNANNETAYTVERATGSGAYSVIATLGVNATSYTDTGVAAGTTYSYKIRVNAGSTYSNYSNVATATISAITVNTPSNLVATANSASLQVGLTWADNATNETAYTVERATGSGAYTVIAFLGANAASYTDTGLAAGTTYSYKVRANAGTTYSNYSNVASATINGAITVNTPSNLVATANSTALQVGLTWTDNATNETAYSVERATGSGSYSVIATLGANVVSYTDTGLAAGTTYSYKVRANAGTTYSSYSNVGTATIASTGVAAPVVSANGVYVDGFYTYWGSAISGTSYEVQLYNSATGWTTFGTSTTYYLYIPKQGATTSYTFRVRAINASGTSNWSNVVDVTLPGALATPTPGNSGIYASGFYSSWVLVNNATSYEVQLYNSATGWSTFGTSTIYYLWIPKQGTDVNYRFRVRAVNATGISEWSNYVDISLPLAGPVAANEPNGSTDKQAFLIYPNPASSNVNFSLNNENITSGTLYIYNSFGKLVDVVRNQSNYSVSHLPKGVYIVKLVDNSIEVTKSLIVK